MSPAADAVRADRASRSRRAYARRTLPIGLAAVAGAALGYLAHHLPPLSSHGPATSLFVLVLATAGALTVGAFAGSRYAPEPPTVLFALRGSATVRDATSADAQFLVAIHADALGHGFFVALGPRFLRAFQRTFIDSPWACALTAEVAGRPVGVLFGIFNPRAHRGWLLKHALPRLAVAGAAALVMRPIASLRFIRTRVGRYARAISRRRHKLAEQHDPPSEDQPCVLSHVAVLEGARGSGSGRVLVEEFCTRAGATGATHAVLVTLDSQEGANGFYSHLGWKSGATARTADGTEMRQWQIALR